MGLLNGKNNLADAHFNCLVKSNVIKAANQQPFFSLVSRLV